MKLRGHKEMMSDPRFPFMVGRMVGTCEAAAILLQTAELSANDLREIGWKLDEVATWFLDDEDKQRRLASEEQTVILPPKEPKPPKY